MLNIKVGYRNMIFIFKKGSGRMKNKAKMDRYKDGWTSER